MRSFFVNIILKSVLMVVLSLSYLAFYGGVFAQECSDRFVMDLGWGSTGREVTDLQNLLRSNGFDIDAVDGYFGWDTQEAVKELQKDNSLKADGLVGREVRVLINEMYCKGVDVEEKSVTSSSDKSFLVTNDRTVCDVDVSGKYEWGDKGDDISILQASLEDLDYVVKVDGVFGRSTYDALYDFQKNRGLQADGVAGPNTIKVLKSVLCGDGNMFAAPEGAEQAVSELLEDEEELEVEASTNPVEVGYLSSVMRGGVVLNRGECNVSISGPLVFGEESDGIYLARELLYRAGYLDLLNNKYDSAMRDAVKRFQLNHDLVPDGLVGKITLTKLNYLNCLIK